MHPIPKSEIKEHPFMYKSIPANKIFADMTYNRPVRRSVVEKIIKEFDPNLVNPCHVNFRDGKYWIFDGNHTLTALVERNGNDSSLLVDCKVYEGLSREEEARLFAMQNGTSTKVPNNYKLRALYEARNPDVLRFKAIVNASGAKCNFIASGHPFCLNCFDTAYKIYQKRGEAHLAKVIGIIIRAWDGNPYSLKRELVIGVDILLSLYKTIDIDRLVEKLSMESPANIISTAKGDGFHTGNKRYAAQLAVIYNKRLSTDKKLDLALL